MFAEMLFRDFCFDIKCVTLTFILLGHWEDNAAMFMLEKKLSESETAVLFLSKAN